MPSDGIAGSYSSFIPSFLKESPDCSQSWLLSVYIPTKSAKVFPFYSTIKRNKCESVELRQMNLEPVKQSEVSQKERNKYRILTHTCGI